MLRSYSKHGVMTDPGINRQLLDDLPREIGPLCRALQGLLVHVFWAQRYGLSPAEVREDEVQIRPFGGKLARILELDDSPLSVTRAPEKRLVCNCRDYSVVLASVLIHQGIPARARCGFGSYFESGRHVDHWVCEYWKSDPGSWVLVDAQLDPLQSDVLAIDFDPLNVPRDRFLVAGKSWEMCRSGQADPELFGIFDMHGMWFIRGNLVRDTAALNRMELLPWDVWGLAGVGDENLSSDDMNLLDRVAAITAADDPDMEVLSALYEADPRLRVPARVKSYCTGGAVEVDIPGV